LHLSIAIVVRVTDTVRAVAAVTYHLVDATLLQKRVVVIVVPTYIHTYIYIKLKRPR
jgi:hypothetical protein